MEKLNSGRNVGAKFDVGGLKGFLTSAATGVTLAAAFGAPAMAEDAPQRSTDTVTVTGEWEGEQTSVKSTAPLLDTPQTVQVIPNEVFAQQGARDLTEILRNTPGITFEAGENGFGTGTANFSMRGFNASGSIFADGARDSGSFNRDAFNVEQVEVVKGPSGDNGRGGAGGYVNIVSKSPHAGKAFIADASVGFDEYDSENRVRAALDINQPFSENVAGRINLLWEDGGVAGREIASRSSIGVAPSVKFGIGTPTRVTLSAQYVSQDDTPDWGVPVALIDGMFRHDPTIDGKTLRDTFYGLAADYDEAESLVGLARLEHAFSPNLDLTAQVRWSNVDRQSSFTVPSGYAPATRLVTTMRIGYGRENESLSGMVNLGARFKTGPFSHRASFGVEASQEDASAQAFPTVTNPGGPAQPILAPNAYRTSRSTIAPTQVSDVSVDTIAAYFYDTIELSRQWELTGGVRVENYDVSISNRTVAGAPLGPNGYDVSETIWSGRLGLVFKPVEQVSLYGSVGVSPLPPGSFLSTPDISREGDNAFPGYSAGMNSAGSKVQEALNYEIGGKWDMFDRKLSATAALFRTERQNVAITGIDPTVTPATPVRLLGYGKQVVEGLELSVAGSVTEKLSVFGGVVFMSSERRHNEFLDAGRRRANPADYGAVLRTNGDELAFTPEFSGNLWATYKLPYNLTVGGGVRHVGESWVGRPDDAERIIPNGNVGVLPSYTVADAMLEWGVSDNAELRLNVNNITDEFYAISTNWAAQRVLLGPARSYTLSLRYRM